MSLPSWERGLKCIYVAIVIHSGIVAPLVGAWIEISDVRLRTPASGVAPLVGAWIEIVSDWGTAWCVRVAPLVGAWIEILNISVSTNYETVAPLVGAWIEIPRQISRIDAYGRSPRGSVD